MGWIDPVTKAVVPPIHMASTYQRDEDNGYSSGRIYARPDNPTFDQAEATLAALEGGPKALVFSSGMSAATACFLALTPRRPCGGAQGDVLVAAQLAGGLRHAMGTESRFRRCRPHRRHRRRRPAGHTKLVWIETPANLTWCVTDIAAAADIAHRAGALLGVDSTVGTPVLTRPIEFGADIVMHSATKYLNGHSDIIAGALVGARDDELGRSCAPSARSSAPSSARPRRGCCCAACARCSRASPGRADRPRLSRAPVVASHGRRSALSRPALLRRTRAAAADDGAASAACCRCASRAASAPPSPRRPASNCSSATSLGGVESLIEHRASVEGTGHALPDRPLAAVGRRRGDDRSVRRSSTAAAAGTTPEQLVSGPRSDALGTATAGDWGIDDLRRATGSAAQATYLKTTPTRSQRCAFFTATFGLQERPSTLYHTMDLLTCRAMHADHAVRRRANSKAQSA